MGRNGKWDLSYCLKVFRKFYEGGRVEAINIKCRLKRGLWGLRIAGKKKNRK
jgi:hypothetical protein